MMRLLIILSIIFFWSCNPYRQIAGDSENRKPWEREILLSEAEKEAYGQFLKDTTALPPPNFDSTRFKAYIEQLELGIQASQEEYYNLSRYFDSARISGTVDPTYFTGSYTVELNKLKKQITNLKNIPPVVKEVKVPWENPYTLQLLNQKIFDLEKESADKDIKISQAQAKQKDAEDGKKAAKKFEWGFYGLIALILLYIGLRIGKVARII